MLLMTAIPVPDLSYLLFCLGLVCLWSMTRPGAIRDDDHRHLPDKPVARLTFVMMSLVLYMALVVGFMVLPGPIADFARSLPAVGGFFSQVSVERFGKEAPIFAALVMGAMTQFPFAKDFERSILIRLHSASNLLKDAVELNHHLRRCKFEPSAIEHQRNLDLGRKYGVHVDTSELQADVPLPMLNWRKVSTLTRLVKDWNESEEKRVLDSRQMEELDRIERAHERKTGVVLEIVKLVEQVDRGVMSPEMLMRSVRILEETPNADREGIAQVESKLRSIIGQNAEQLSRPLRITSSAFRRDIARIGGYFQEEYEILLGQVSDLAARSVVLSGAAAPGRLDAMKEAGFGGLGRIEPISLDRVLITIFSISFLGFLILFVGNIGNNMGPNAAERLARFAFIMSVAALTGSLVGSRRTHAKAPQTPWSAYFAAGLLAAVVMIGVNWATALIQQYQGIELPAGQQPFALRRSVPWTLLPFMVTVTICRLGRLDHWFAIPSMGRREALIERAIDGVCVSLALMIGTYGAIAVLQLLGEPLPPSLQEMIDKTQGHRVMPLPIIWPLQFLGFLIGFVTGRDVRHGAHSRMIETGALEPATVPPSAPVIERPVTTAGLFGSAQV